MSDIDELLKSVAPAATRPTPEAVNADLARGRAALVSARRRRTLRRATLGATSLALAAAAVVVTGAAGGSHASRTVATGGLSPVQTAPDLRNTAYIVTRVRAKIADDINQDNTAQQSFGYRSGELGSDGSLNNLGPKQYQADAYTGSDGTQYFHDTKYDSDGSPTLIASSVFGPVVNGTRQSSGTTVDPTNRTYNQGQSVQPVPGAGNASADPSPGLSSSPSELQQALRSGQVAQMGAPVFNGTQAIALAINTPRTPGYQSVLYVDPQTYEPLGQAYVPDPGNTAPDTGIDVTYWVPATAGNIAMAKDTPAIPTGYTKVARATG